MKNLKKLLLTLAISYAIVLSVNLSVNFRYYAAGNDWRFSVFFCIIVTTLGWAGGVLLFEILFKKYINWKKKPNTKLVLSVLISGIYGVVLMVLVMKSMVWFLHFNESPVYEYIDNSVYSMLFAMLIGLIVNGQEFLKQWKKSTEENERMKKEALRSQYELLKSQINPHFFFNSLNTLVMLIPEQPMVAVSFVQQLSKVFRYSLEYNEEGTVNIETELKIVSAYLFLNEQRFGSKLIVNIRLQEEVMPLHIVTQSLLMLTENVLKHNEISSSSQLAIHIYNEGVGYLVVSNNFQRKGQSERSLGIGLPNIVDRFKLVSDKPVIIEKENGMFTVKIPLLKK